MSKDPTVSLPATVDRDELETPCPEVPANSPRAPQDAAVRSLGSGRRAPTGDGHQAQPAPWEELRWRNFENAGAEPGPAQEGLQFAAPAGCPAHTWLETIPRHLGDRTTGPGGPHGMAAPLSPFLCGEAQQHCHPWVQLKPHTGGRAELLFNLNLNLKSRVQLRDTILDNAESILSL